MRKSLKLFTTVLLAIACVESGAMTFVHPGARSGKYELDFVKAKIVAKAEPWTSHLNAAKTAGSDSKALGLALDWYYTGNVASANAAITALKGWNSHAAYEPPPDNGGNQNSLEGAWAASVLAPAAEILSLYSGWSDVDKAATKQMFRTVFLPALLKMSYWNGNVDLTQLDALMSVAVFLDDQTSFDAGIERLKKRLPAYFYLASDNASVRTYANGSYNWSAANKCAPAKWVDGITQETCRDNDHHAQFAIAAAIAALETAWLQGVDLYTPNQERMVKAMELMALQLSSKDMQGTCTNNTTTYIDGDADRYNTLEIGYNHYHNRKGVAMPETWKEIQKELRSSGRQQFNMFHETLTHGDILYKTTAIADKFLQPTESRATIAFAPNGKFELRSNTSTIQEVATYTLNGTVTSRFAANMTAGTSRTFSTSPSQSLGVYLVTVRSSNGLETFKSVR